jgi:hypothetical protein
MVVSGMSLLMQVQSRLMTPQRRGRQDHGRLESSLELRKERGITSSICARFPGSTSAAVLSRSYGPEAVRRSRDIGLTLRLAIALAATSQSIYNRYFAGIHGGGLGIPTDPRTFAD